MKESRHCKNYLATSSPNKGTSRSLLFCRSLVPGLGCFSVAAHGHQAAQPEQPGLRLVLEVREVCQVLQGCVDAALHHERPGCHRNLSSSSFAFHTQPDGTQRHDTLWLLSGCMKCKVQPRFIHTSVIQYSLLVWPAGKTAPPQAAQKARSHHWRARPSLASAFCFAVPRKPPLLSLSSCVDLFGEQAISRSCAFWAAGKRR